MGLADLKGCPNVCGQGAPLVQQVLIPSQLFFDLWRCILWVLDCAHTKHVLDS